ncbi:hypothetical protein [Brevundimonas denitrificans]|uniref:hypothetical protein n=1 Tax=Brevundimonas denitrificans TaxID=1443434 RepID=UPI00223B8912|nr:hypothetical protein [Brevundimonas denitrificans]
MRKLHVAAFISLDGVMQAPGGPEEDRSGGFAHGGWVFPHFDEALGEEVDRFFARPGRCCWAARPTTSSPPTGRTRPTPLLTR